jgi:hypothetical protein
MVDREQCFDAAFTKAALRASAIMKNGEGEPGSIRTQQERPVGFRNVDLPTLLELGNDGGIEREA